MNQDDTAEKELEQHMDYLESKLEEMESLENDVEDYIDLIYDADPLEALNVLENSYTPAMESLIDDFSDLEYSYEPLNKLVAHQLKSYEEQFQVHYLLLENFQHIQEMIEKGEINSIDPPNATSVIISHLEQTNKEQKMEVDQMVSIAEEEFSIDEEKLSEIDNVERMTEADLEEAEEAFDDLIDLFTASLLNISDSELAFDNSEENNLNESNNKDSANTNVTLKDRGNPFVIIEAEAEFDENLIITGESNLLEGSKVYLSSRVFGLSNPYIEGEAEVDAEGQFTTTIQMTEEEYTEEPIVLTLNFKPEEDMYDIYGELGEYIEGPLTQMQNNSLSHHRTRVDALVTAELILKNGERATFAPIAKDIPDDQGELDIWIEPTLVNVQDDFYEIELASNLVPLTGINIDIEIPDHRVAGYKSYGRTRDDGSVRYHVKRVDDREIEDNADVTFVVTAVADESLHSIEYYGMDGENFSGDLTEKTKKGKKIVYQFKLADYR